MMKKIAKVFLTVAAILALIVVAGLAYLQLVYLPQKVESWAALYLEQRSKGQIQYQSVRYLPFQGAELKGINVFSQDRRPLFNIDKLYIRLKFWPLIIQRNLDFRVDLYPPKIKRPFTFKGLYQIEQRQLSLNCKIPSNLFVGNQYIYGTFGVLMDREEKTLIDCKLTSKDIDLQGKLYIESNDLHISSFSGNILQTNFDFIGDIQNLSQPVMNIYGDVNLNLEDLKNLNLKDTTALNRIEMAGRCKAKIYITAQPNNPEIGLKISSAQINIGKTSLENLSIVSKLENKELSFSKCYARLYGGEVNLQGACWLDAQDLPANLDLNIFNLDVNRIIKDVTAKDIPIHGRLFSLGRLNGYLQEPGNVEGKVWLSVSGSNILQLPLFKGIAELLRLPEMRQVEFKEASGNFTIGKRQIQTRDFKIASSHIMIQFNGYTDFSGDLAYDIQPSFSQDFLSSAPNINNILGIFIDSAGNFLGAVKMKGNIKKPRYTFKAISMEKLLPKGIEDIEKTFKQLFKFKKKE